MIRFGTGGWRAIIADGFTKANLQLLTAGLCKLMEEEGHLGRQICVGYDRRFLSKESARWAAEVLAGNGFRVYMVNRSSPTPLIMFTVKQLELPYGMAITASHNPAIYNGVKVFTAGGRDADQQVTGRIEDCIASIQDRPVKTVDYDQAVASGLVEEGYPFNSYVDSILDMVQVNAIRQARLRIAIDPMYGVGQSSLRTILLTCRCDVDVIHEQHDTLFGGRMPAPSAQALKTLSHYVVEHGCSLGIATDGDADRLGVIDEQGRYVHPNQLLVMLYYYLVKYRGWQGPCVRNHCTTHLLDRVAEDLGQVCYEVPVGFKHISAKMTETNAVIGGESSGGLAVRGHISGKDGIYAAALLVEMLAVTGQTVSGLYGQILRRYGQLHYEDQAIALNPRDKAELKQRLEKGVPNFGKAVERVSRTDGCKVYFADGSWTVCRFSGTEPVLRIAGEGHTLQGVQEDIACWRKTLGV